MRYKKGFRALGFREGLRCFITGLGLIAVWGVDMRRSWSPVNPEALKTLEPEP